MVNNGQTFLSVLIKELIASQHLWNDILLDLITNYDRHTITGALARGETHPPYPSWGVGEDVLICLCLASRKLQCFHTETGKRRNSIKTKNDMVPMIVVLYSSRVKCFYHIQLFSSLHSFVFVVFPLLFPKFSSPRLWDASFNRGSISLVPADLICYMLYVGIYLYCIALYCDCYITLYCAILHYTVLYNTI